ncbi:MAG: hypothetical protein Q8O10_07965 [candidate division Zixibacteria bacterium]|nr:hypothetical protein [candidate division Zixibacteria bacterium]
MVDLQAYQFIYKLLCGIPKLALGMFLHLSSPSNKFEGATGRHWQIQTSSIKDGQWMSIKYGQPDSIICGIRHLSTKYGQEIEYIEIYIC